MSIYATWLLLEDDHAESCAIWAEDPEIPGVFDLGNEPCDCGQPWLPWRYQGSHVLPAIEDSRGGWVEVGAIPNQITRDGVEEGLHDWLRLTVNDGVVVLDRAQVLKLRDTLTQWLEAEERA